MIRTESDFLKFAFSRYDNPHLSSIAEFESDLKRFTYLNNLFNRYREDKSDIKGRLILNHIVILGNTFTVSGVIDMLNFRILPENIYLSDTCLKFLGYIDKTQYDIDFYLLDILNEY